MLTMILVGALFGVAIWGIFSAVIAPYFSGQLKTEARVESIAPKNNRERPENDQKTAQQKRAKLHKSLKQLDIKESGDQASLEARLISSGLNISLQEFYTRSAGVGTVLTLIALIISQDFLFSLGVGFVGGFGLPRWYLGYLERKRISKFLEEFPNALEVLIRGVKAGMPLLDCLRIVATEGEEPLKSEFKLIMDKQGFGLTVPQAIETLYERVPTPEVNFFSIVIGVQQKAGGNLSEALSNLSKVLRDRKKLRQKVDAMSSEAKASAGIIAAMPFFVGFMTYLSSPDYISLLWTHPTGRFFMGFCAFWMICGVLIMKKMINFKI